MRRIFISSGGAAILALSSGFAGSTAHDVDDAPTKPRSLCAANEVVAFTYAVTGQRIVSVCASPDLSEAEGHLQYHFDKGEKIELSLPPDGRLGTANWRKDIKYGREAYAGGGAGYLRFEKPPFSYIVYTAIGRGWGEKQGVMVMKNGKMLSYRRCVGPYTADWDLESLSRVGIAVDDSEDFELPQ